MLTAATGIKKFADMQYLAQVGERIVNLERAYNVRAGFNRKHDTLPERFLTEPLHTMGAEGEGEGGSSIAPKLTGGCRDVKGRGEKNDQKTAS